MLSKRLGRDTLVHQTPQGGRHHAAVSMHQRLGRNHDAHSTLDARRRTHDDVREGASHGYHPRRGGRYDSGKDWSLSLGLPGPQAFDQHILNAAFPIRY